MCDLLVERFLLGVEDLRSLAAEAQTSGNGEDSTKAMQVPGEAGSRAGGVDSGKVASKGVALDAKVGMAAEFVILGMRCCQSPSLQHVLLKLLSGLFQAQVRIKYQASAHWLPLWHVLLWRWQVNVSRVQDVQHSHLMRCDVTWCVFVVTKSIDLRNGAIHFFLYNEAL